MKCALAAIWVLSTLVLPSGIVDAGPADRAAVYRLAEKHRHSKVHNNVPRAVRDRIVRKVMRDYPGDSRTIAYWVRRQLEAYQTLQKYAPSQVANSDLFRIKSRAAADHPDDYVMQLHVLGQQSEAYAALRNYRNNRLPKDVFNRVKAAIAKDHPYNYVTQLYVIRHKIAWYVQEDRRQHPNVRPIPELF